MSGNLNDSTDAAVQFAESTSRLRRVLECPVCLDVAEVPTRICLRGHIMCSSCADKLCPVCQSTFLDHSLVCINNVLEALPYFCRYADVGCKEAIVRGNTHELFCGFRTFTCREAGCGEKVKVLEAEEHYFQKHEETNHCLKRKVGDMHWVKPRLEELESYDEPVLWDGSFGYIRFNNNTADGNLKVSYHVFPVGKAKKDAFLRVEFQNEKFLFASTIKPTILTGENDSECNTSEFNDAEYCLKVPQIYLLGSFGTDFKINFEYFKRR